MKENIEIGFLTYDELNSIVKTYQTFNLKEKM